MNSEISHAHVVAFNIYYATFLLLLLHVISSFNATS